MGRGHGKGSEFERHICKLLSLWWTGQARDDIFWRSSISGGRAKIRANQGKSTFGQYGDLTAIDPIGHILLSLGPIELKCGYGRASIGDVLDKGPNQAMQPWEHWLEQVLLDASNAKSKYWILITRRDRREAMIFIPAGLMIALNGTGSCLSRVKPQAEITIRRGEQPMTIVAMQLKRFLTRVSPDNIKDVVNRIAKGEEI